MMLSCPSLRRRLSGKWRKLIDAQNGEERVQSLGCVRSRNNRMVKRKCFWMEEGGAQTEVTQ